MPPVDATPRTSGTSGVLAGAGTHRPQNGATPAATGAAMVGAGVASVAGHQVSNLEGIGNFPETFGQTLFAIAVLTRLGITAPSPHAIAAFVGWEKQEGGHWHNTAKHNPLNTTEPMPGAGNTGTQGNIKVYPSWSSGVDATVKTLKLPAYAAIRQALRGSNQTDIASAVSRSPWGTKQTAAITGTTPGDIQKSWVNGINPKDPFDPSALPGQVAGAVTAIPNAVKSVGDILNAAWNELSSANFWLRVGQIVLGLAALIFGASMIGRQYLPNR